MRGRALLGVGAAVAVLGAAAWFVAGDDGDDAPGGVEQRGAKRTSEATVPAADARAPGAAAAPDSDAAAQRTVDPTAPSAVAPRRILGRVVDGRRVGVAGARVRFCPKDRDELEVVSREGGAFEFTIASVESPSLRGMLLAIGPDGSMGTSFIALAADPEAGAAAELDRDRERVVLTLLPPARLVVHVRDEQGPVAGARVTVDLSSMFWLFEEARLPVVATDATGTAVLGVPVGDTTVVATVPGRATARQWTTCESGIEQTIDLVLHPTYSVTIRVRDAQTRAPVAGARLVFEEPVLDTSSRAFSYSPPQEIWFSGCVPDVACDDAGIAHLDDVDPNRRRSVTARAPGYGRHDHSRANLDGTSREIELLLTPRPAHDVRIPIVAGELPVPPDGTVVKLRLWSGSFAGLPDSATVAQGELVFTDDADERRTAIATAPDGSCGQFHFGGTQPLSPFQFRRPRTLTLRLRHADGRSAPHAAIVLSENGGTESPRRREADDEGRIVCSGLFAGRVEVLETGANPIVSQLAAFDLRAGDVEADVVIRERCEARLAVTIDGQPGLPPTFRLSRPDGEIRVDAEDPERGELRVSTRANATDEEIKFWFVARSFPPAPFQLPVVRGGEPPVVPIALTHGARLLVEVRRAVNQKIALRIQQLGADGEFANLALQNDAVKRVDGPRGSFAFGPLEAGTWRVLDEITSIATEPFVLVSGERRTEILDLARALVVHGRVTVPDGTNLSLVRIVARGESLEVTPNRFGQDRYPGTGVFGDGTFERTVDGANPFVRAWHPSLAPPPGDPFVEIRDPARAIELTLVDRPSLTFTIVRPDGANLPHKGSFHEGLAVVLDREDGDREHSTRSLPLSGAATEVVKVAEIPAGRWTVFLDPGGEFAPVLRTGVDIPDSGRDLGEITIGGGSAVRLRISDARANRDTSFNVSARHVGAPEYTRWWQRAAGPELLLPGLGAGRFEFTLSNSLGKDLWTGTIEADGTHETALAVALH